MLSTSHVAMTIIVMTLLLLSGILVAPHLTFPEERKYALICLGLALMFWWCGRSNPLRQAYERAYGETRFVLAAWFFRSLCRCRSIIFW